MEALLKGTGCALCAALLALLIKKSNPELSLVLALGTGAVILLLAAEFVGPLRELAELICGLSDTAGIYLGPAAKCVGIGMVTKLTAELCKDAGQAYLAGTVEILGSGAALCAALPLFITLLTMLGELA